MKLEKITVENFRQFYKDQPIKFSEDEDQNLTIVHGGNGAGKSAIRNAFTWLFYHEVDDNFSRPDHIANERAMAEVDVDDIVRVRVVLEFSDGNQDFWCERWADYKKQNPTDIDGEPIDEGAVVQYIDADGRTVTPDNPTSYLEQFIPKRLSHLFFFHGEDIDKLTQEDHQERVKEAIRDLMGLEILERSIRHLEAVKDDVFSQEMKDTGSEELSELTERKDRKQEERDDKKRRLKNTKRSIREAEDELEDVENRLRELEGARELQEERDDLEREEDQLKDEIEDLNDEIKQVCSDNGHFVFAMPAVQKTAEALEEKREKGEIPSDIKQQFVEELLDIEDCICDRPLKPGSEPYQAVKNWKNKAGTGDLDQVAINITSRLNEIIGSREALFDKIQENLQKRNRHERRLDEIEEELDEISAKLEDKDTEDIRRLEQRRGELKNEIKNLGRERDRIQRQIDDIEDDVEEIEQDIEEAEQKKEEAELARRRFVSTQKAKNFLQDEFESYQDQVREQVEDKVDEIFSDIIAKNYWTEIGEDYSLEVYKEVGDQVTRVGTSTGERQVASFSFIGALTYLTRQQFLSSGDQPYFKGGVYPMLMDAPFGYLEEEYRQEVSKKIPKLADQVIVLVSDSQWGEEVKAEVEPYAGKQYHLNYYDTEEDNVEYEYTEILEDREAEIEV